jgi:hypothetical protein
MSQERPIDAADRLLKYWSCLGRLQAAGVEPDEWFADALWLSRFWPESATTVGRAPLPSEEGGEFKVRPSPETGDPSQDQTSPSVEGPPVVTPLEPAHTRGIYAAPPIGRDRSATPASAVRVPGGSALPGTMAISRAFRPFRRFRESIHEQFLDEQETVDQTARCERLTLVFRPVRETLLEVALVVEETASMVVWRRTVTEFQRLLEQHGAFRDVRRWRLRLQPQVTLLNRSGVMVSPRSLVDPQGSRLILIFTQGTHGAWKQQELYDWLWSWGAHQPIAILQLLPARLWKNTAIGPAVTNCKSPGVAVSNSKLEARLPSWYDPADPAPLPIPMVTLEAEALGTWARMTMGMRSTESPSLLIDRQPEPDPLPTPEPPQDPKQRIGQFEHSASREAFDLISHLAPIQFNVSVMRLVQRVILGGHARQTQLAEVLLSGLIERVTPDHESDAEEVVYKVGDDIASILRSSVTMGGAVNILKALSQFISEHSRETIEFTALLPESRGQLALPPWAQPFARAGEQLSRYLEPSQVTRPARPGLAGDRSAGEASLGDLLIALEPLDLEKLSSPTGGPHPLLVLRQAGELTGLAGLEESRFWFCLAVAAYVSESKLDQEQPPDVRRLLARLRRFAVLFGQAGPRPI